MRPESGFSVIKLIEKAGFQVIVPPTQTCCGQPAYNSGDRPLAHELAEKTLREFESFDYVAVPSGSCGGMIRAHYGDLFRDDPQLMSALRAHAAARVRTDGFAGQRRQVAVAARRVRWCRHVSRFLLAGLRELGVKAQPRELLAQAGVPVTEMKGCEHCCGFGGTFAVKYGDLDGHRR